VPEAPGTSPFGTFDTARPGAHMHGACRASGQIVWSGWRPPAEADMSWPSRSRPGLGYPVDGVARCDQMVRRSPGHVVPRIGPKSTPAEADRGG